MSALSGKRVLVVEDEPVVAMALEDMLVELGCVVLGPAYSLEQALQLIATEAIDAAVLDINLNGERSYPVADALNLGGVPYAFATGYAPEGIDRQSRSPPVLEKPYRLHQLEHVLGQLLDEVRP
jgi:CheY-like chemotaxis protein